MKAEVAQKVADEVFDVIYPSCTNIQVAGSLRRRKAEIGDVDIIAIPLDRNVLQKALERHYTLITNGEKVKAFEHNGVHVDLYLPSLDEYEPTLMHRTGSKCHNIAIAKRATAMGYHLSTSKGILGGSGQVVASTEKEIFRVLGLTYKEPWERE